MFRHSGLLFVCALVGANLAGVGPSQPLDPRAEGVSLGLAYAFNEAEQAFAKAERASPAERLAQLGRAAALLNAQPRTAARLDASRAMLERLLSIDRHDEAGLDARYLLARIHHQHDDTPDLATARRLYRELFDDAPAHPLGQAAGVKLALLSLYDADNPDIGSRFTLAEALLSRVTLAAPRSDLLVVLGRSVLHFRRPPSEALHHFEAARQLGFSSRAVQADTLVALVNLAAETGNAPLARECLAELTRGFPRDPRSAWLAQPSHSSPASP